MSKNIFPSLSNVSRLDFQTEVVSLRDSTLDLCGVRSASLTVEGTLFGALFRLVDSMRRRAFVTTVRRSGAMRGGNDREAGWYGALTF